MADRNWELLLVSHSPIWSRYSRNSNICNPDVTIPVELPHFRLVQGAYKSFMGREYRECCHQRS
jgi:hypothetical protein